MKRLKFLFFALFIIGAMPAFSQVSNDNEDGVYKIDERAGRNDFVPGQVLVKFKDESGVQVRSSPHGKFRTASVNAVDQLLKEFGAEDMEKLFPNEEAKPVSNLQSRRAPNGTTVKERNLDKVFLVKMASERLDSTTMLIDRLKQMEDVEYAEPNYKVYITADVPFGYGATESYQQRSVRRAPIATETTAEFICLNPSSNPLYFRQYGIIQQKIHKLWNKEIINKKRPVIAILDTGVDITHPDLVDNIWTNTKEAEGERAYDDDGNNIVDDIHGWNFIDDNGDLTDRYGHGTHVAGIAAAADNNIGIVGANPLALIMPIKVMNDRGVGDVATICRGIVYAAENGADIINMSFGHGGSLSETEVDAIKKAYQTAILVASAGNNGKPIYNNQVLPGTLYPAAYYLVLGVEASGSNMQRSAYSNFDPDGPIYSEDGIDGRNYEIQVPGDMVYSTLPGGQYNKLTGTSMSAPLLAGAISALQMVKDYPSKDVLFGDLIHLNADFEKIYSDETPRWPKIDVVSMEVDDDVMNNNADGQVDAGETIKFYPVLRNTWADATGIKLTLSVDNYYKGFVQIINPQVAFGHSISAYGRQKAESPIVVQFSNKISNNTRIRFTLKISYHENKEPIQQDIYVTVYNMVKLGGLIASDMTLTADKNYLVTSNLAIPEGVTLTIEPGTVVNFEGAGLSSSGILKIEGTPEKQITLKGVQGMIIGNSAMTYTKIKNVYFTSGSNGYFENCQFLDCDIQQGGFSTNTCNIIGGRYTYNSVGQKYCNYVGTRSNGTGRRTSDPSGLSLDYNVIDAHLGTYQYALYSDLSTPKVIKLTQFPYLGSGRENIVRQWIADINTGQGFGEFDLSNMPTRPYAEAHGIVWKVMVNGKDAQDEYEELDPLGVGKHKFEVYFNRPMNKAKIPQVTFGVREPYNQHSVDEDGSWNDEGTIYTAYKTITGKTMSDGENRIYVQGAEDNEYFECPYEKTRFNINIQAAGSMATGFAGEAKMGRVDLTWTSKDNDFSDAMGFNIYRYTIDKDGNADTVRINQEVILVKEVEQEDPNNPVVQSYEYTDYDVIPDTTYYYLYKVISTDLKEYDVSNVVAVKPLTTVIGDVNGSGEVDVNDVVTTVNYVVGEQPKPFIFEAADMNKDLYIDVLDVIGIVQKVINPNAASRVSIESMAQAVYTIEDGELYVETPLALAGLQIQFNSQFTIHNSQFAATKDMKGFEMASAWLTESDYRMLAYSFGSKVLTPGKHAIMTIGDADITSLRLSDTQGNAVLAVPGEATRIADAMGSKVMNTKGVWNLSGQKVMGNSQFTIDNSQLRKGVYIIDGQKVVK